MRDLLEKAGERGQGERGATRGDRTRRAGEERRE